MRFLAGFIERHPVGRWTLNFLLIALLGGAGFWLHTENNRWEPILCTFRDGIESDAGETEADAAEKEVRIGRQKKYIADVRAGRRLPIPNVTIKEIQESIDETQASLDRDTKTARTQRERVEQLSDLNCD